jgi:retron-type reverse transcriptase
MSSEETATVHRNGQWVKTKLGLITERAGRDPKCRFSTLAYLLNEGYLLACFRELKLNKAPGIDGVTVRQYEENLYENITDLVARLKARKYRPQPVRRVYIPKDEKSKRPLGIPIVEDKIVQMGIKKILEAIYEVDFRDISHGFRPKRSCHDALDVVDKAIMTRPVNYIVDMDIEKFFDTVDHRWMMECLKQRISDPNLLKLIARFLKAGVMEEGKYMETDKGTPQGGVISPVLANIYLHYVLDLWYEKRVMNEWLKEVRNQMPLKAWWQVLRQKLTGHYRYYGISGNTYGLLSYYHETVRLAHKWVNRRSQKKSFDWARYRRYLQWNPLPEPKIYHRTYTSFVA